MAEVGGVPEELHESARGLRRAAAGYREMRSELHDGGTLAAALGSVPLAAALDRALAALEAESLATATQIELLAMLADNTGTDLGNAAGL